MLSFLCACQRTFLGCVILVLSYVFLYRIGDFDIRITAHDDAIVVQHSSDGLFLAVHFCRLQGAYPESRSDECTGR
ncbi:hypothetical protein BG74_01475 [Sodalis-like endosymbiont of Proechinophthirus fluctus]|uniref:hypothetical protein n=1 Tax=Sodalis-like endosymbiont of Proechinophthirus fluctus TaxID=1462730 RepID=UPI0007A80239|nr:hypothetical protein [Sodalis-like endosymbiont of Proechinophthirus fluctus]KYP97621.1 hypothetical protein BG74_01475 [Sodalis-like endosymbiont of Proechinophthirus fluctus]